MSDARAHIARGTLFGAVAPAWKVSPPTEPIETLADLVADFRRLRSDPASPLATLSDNIVAWCTAAPNLSAAINRACASLRPDGRVHNHQSRIPLAVKQVYAANLKKRKHILDRAKNFEEVLRVCEDSSVPGVGPVYAYDVATRIGGHLKKPPHRFLYLHAGVREGAAALGIETAGRHKIARRELPAELHELTTDEIEDFLCTYRAVFDSIEVESR